MKFRFQVLEPNIGIGSSACGVGYLAIAGGSCNVVIDVNGVNVLTEDIIAPGALGPVVVGALTVTPTINAYVSDFVTGNPAVYVTLEIAGLTENNYCTLDITVSRGGYITYENTCRMYDRDIGNNPNVLNGAGVRINYNPNFDIVLNDSVNNYVSAEFAAYRVPFTNTIEVVQLSSINTIATYAYSIDDTTETLAIPNGQMVAENDAIVRSSYTDSNGSVCTGNVTVARIEWTPIFAATIDISEPVGDELCTTINSNNTAIINLDMGDFDFIYRDDALVRAFTSLDIDYELYDSADNPVALGVPDTFNIPDINVVTTWNPVPYRCVNFQIATPGDYYLRVILSSTDTSLSFSDSKDYDLEVCYFFKVIYDSTRTGFEIYNTSGGGITVQIEKYDNGTLTVLEAALAVGADSMVPYIPIGDDFYYFTYNDGGNDYIYILFSDLILGVCRNNLLKYLICGDYDSKKAYEYMSMNAMMQVFYNLLAENLQGVSYFSVIPADTSTLIGNLDTLLTKLTEYCNGLDVEDCKCS